MDQPTRTKILFVITKSNWGGAQKYVYTLATGLPAVEFDVSVAFGQSGQLDDKLQTSGIITHRIKSLQRDASLFADVKSFFELLALLRTEKPRIVHLNSSKAGGIGALAARLAGVPSIIFTAHGWPHRETRSACERAIIKLASWLTVALSHQVIVVSSCDLKDAPALFFKEKLTLIYNGIDPNAPLLKTEEARSRLHSLAPHLELGVPRIVCIGELTENKAYDVLLPALAEVSSPFSCIIMGEGGEREHILSLIRSLRLDSKVACVGFVSQASSLLSGADILVLSSRKEGFPFVLLEAGRASIAVVASNTGGVPELIQNETTGILVPPEDAGALAKAIGLLITNPALRNIVATNIHERVLSDFSEKRMTDQTFSLYR